MAIISTIFTGLFWFAAIATPIILAILIYLTFVGAQDPDKQKS